MKHTCLSKGGGFHFPPCHILEICGFRVLLDCPIDLSALTIFSPVPTGFYRTPDGETCRHSAKEDRNLEPKRRRIEKPLQANDLICAEPWYKTVKNLHLWDSSFIDVVLISSPMGMLGLPFLTRNNKLSAKVQIYATEATTRLAKLMMEDLMSMHMEFRQFYGPEESDFPQWLRWEELELLPLPLLEVIMGGDGGEMGSWQPLYSAEDVKDCLNKVQSLKYAEEVCYNGTLIIKAFSSGLEIGASNWTITGSGKSTVCLSSSIFSSAHAMSFDFRSLQGNDLILFSDFSLLHNATEDVDGTVSLPPYQAPNLNDLSTHRDQKDKDEEIVKSIVNTDECSEEMDKLAFICSHAIDSVKAGGSVLVPFGRLGIVLQLLEQIALFLESSNMKVPIFIVSSVAEEILAFTNVVPEWLCKQRQEKLYSGEALFGHVELIKQKYIHVYPAVYSSEFLMMWQEPCIVFTPHWSLRTGPAVHFLQRWRGDKNSLLVLEEGVNADIALLPFKPVAMKVLQCSFLCGIRLQKVQLLLEMLQPKLVLFPEDLKLPIHTSTQSFPFLNYSLNKTLCVPRLRNDFEVSLSNEMVLQLKPKRVQQGTMALARLKGKLYLDHGKYVLAPSKETPSSSEGLPPPLHWGSLDPNVLLAALQEKGIAGSIGQDSEVGTSSVLIIQIHEPDKALIEIHSTHTVISSAEKTLGTLIYETIGSVLDGI